MKKKYYSWLDGLWSTYPTPLLAFKRLNLQIKSIYLIKSIIEKISLILSARTFFTSITQPCQDLVEPVFFVHMKHGKKNVNIGWRVNADIIRLLFFLGWSKYINKINNRKDFFDFVHNPTKLFFFVPMNRRQKMLILVRGLILNLLGPCLLTAKYINKINI